MLLAFSDSVWSLKKNLLATRKTGTMSDTIAYISDHKTISVIETLHRRSSDQEYQAN